MEGAAPVATVVVRGGGTTRKKPTMVLPATVPLPPDCDPEEMLGRWWTEACERTYVPRDCRALPWAGLRPVRVENDKDLADKLAARSATQWFLRLYTYDGFLFYQVEKPIVSAHPEKSSQLRVHGVLTRFMIDKWMRRDAHSRAQPEVLRRLLCMSDVEAMINSDHAAAQLGRGQWFYPQIASLPSEFGSAEECEAQRGIAEGEEQEDGHTGASSRNHAKAFAELVRRLIRLEHGRRKQLTASAFSPFTDTGKNWWTSFRAQVRDHHLFRLDLSTARDRCLDKFLRQLLFYAYLLCGDEEERSILEDVSAHLMQAMVEVGWPYERHVALLLEKQRPGAPFQRVLCDPESLQRMMPSSSFSGAPETGESGCAASASCSRGRSLRPFALLLHPDDDVREVRARLDQAIAQLLDIAPLLALVDDAEDVAEDAEESEEAVGSGGDGNSNSSADVRGSPVGGERLNRPLRFVNMLPAQAWRLRDAARRVCAISHNRHHVTGSHPDALAPSGQWLQVVFEPLPTRLYLLRRRGAPTDDDPEGTDVVDVCAQAQAFVQTYARCDEDTACRLVQTRSPYKLTEEMHLHVFPHVIVPSLSQLRAALLEGWSDDPRRLPSREAYVDGTVFPTLPWMAQRDFDDVLALQPSHEQIERCFCASTGRPSPPGSDPTPTPSLDLEVLEGAGSPEPIDDSVPICAEDLAVGCHEVLKRFSAHLPNYEPPQQLWLEPDQTFSFNPPDESPEDRGVVLVEMRREFMSRTGQLRHGVRLVNYCQVGFAMGSRVRLLYHQTRDNVIGCQYGGDARRAILEAQWSECPQEMLSVALDFLRHCLEQDAPTRTGLLPHARRRSIDLTGSQEGIPRPHSALPGSRSFLEEHNRPKGDTTVAMQMAREQKEDAQRHQLAETRARATWRRLPGSKADRDEWAKKADAEGDLFRDFLYKRNPHDDPKQSISITPIAMDASYGEKKKNDGEPPAQESRRSFLWSDMKGQRRMGGRGAWQLAVFQLAVAELCVATSDEVADIKQRLKSGERTVPILRDGKQTTRPFTWCDELMERVDHALARKHHSSPPKDPGEPPQTANATVWESIRKFAESRPAGLAGAAGLHASVGIAKQPQPPSDQDPSMIELRQLIDQSTSITSTVGAAYLRTTRGLDALSPDVLEASPFLRFVHQAKYSIRTPRGQHDGSRKGPRASTLVPALLLLCCDPRTGQPTNGQRIFLLGSKKLSIDEGENGTRRPGKRGDNPAKKSIGKLLHPFFVQPGNLDHVSIVYLAEGPETAWSVAAASRLLCVYCVFGVGNYGKFRQRMDHPSRPAVCLCLDRDQAGSAVLSAIEALKAAGWPRVYVVMPDCDDGCNDFNDVLLRHGRDYVAWRLRVPLLMRFVEWPRPQSLPSSRDEWARYGDRLPTPWRT